MSLPLTKFRDLSFKSSIYGIEERIVLDIGSCYLKCGFSGEARPRKFLSMHLSEEAMDDYLGLRPPVQQHLGRPCGESCSDGVTAGLRAQDPTKYAELYDLDLMRVSGQGYTEQDRLKVLEDRLFEYLYDVYFKYLLTDPKQRKVIICESPLAPIALKEAIAKVLFKKLQVPSISFAPTHLLALLTTGTATGLVIDCGHLETSVLPIYATRPLTPFIQSTPRAGKFLSNHLKQLLRSMCPITLVDNPTDMRVIPEAMLTDAFLETIKTRILFASPLMITARDDVSQDEMNARYRDMSGSSEVHVEVYLQEEQARGVLAIPGWIRERACECLFTGDEDAESVTTVILEAVLRAPSDLRRPLISSLLLIGGTAQLPNFQNRLLQELKRELQTNKRWKALSGLADAVRFLDDLTDPEQPPPPPSSAMEAEKELQADLESLPARSRTSVSGSSSRASLQFDRRRKRDTAPKPYISSGRVFMPNCRGWIGGSLIGSLKASGPELLRENYNGTVPDWSTSDMAGAIAMPLYEAQ
ncbi:hypothetical protein BGW41_003758 [Actinomortierella wolfii]|nr:hypothetical protein BGW41_003758 [Actinomortierella wolfii]